MPPDDPSPAPPTESVALARILLVDDEPSVLEGLTRAMRSTYSVVTATSGVDGLRAMEQDGPFAAIVSDMRMPGMDGARFLAEARAADPAAVRILLTGYADTESAAAAVNEGQIFRFLEKPCATERVKATLADAVEHHRLITAERELLETTLRGSVEVLTDVLALVSPVAFARALRLKRVVVRLADALKVKERWAIELAAMLSELGSITVPPDVLQRHYCGEPLTSTESEMIAAAPDVAKQLIGHVPRLEPVREILLLRHAAFDGSGMPRGFEAGAAIPIGARLLLIATDFDVLESRGGSPAQCVDVMESREGLYDPAALRVLREVAGVTEKTDEIREVRLIDVVAGMVFARDVVATNGLVLIGRGQEATPSLVRRIRNFWHDLPLQEMPLVISRRAE